MRLLPLLVLLVAAPASAQSWTMDGMLDEMVPVLLDAATADFAPLRGDLLNTNGADSLWASTYRPEGPSGPLYSRTAHNRSVEQSMFWFTVQAPDTVFAQRLYGVALTSLNNQVGAVEGTEGLGWTLAVAENSDVQKVVQWVECASVGRVLEALYRPTDTGAEISISLVRRGRQNCPPGG